MKQITRNHHHHATSQPLANIPINIQFRKRRTNCIDRKSFWHNFLHIRLHGVFLFIWTVCTSDKCTLCTYSVESRLSVEVKANIYTNNTMSSSSKSIATVALVIELRCAKHTSVSMALMWHLLFHLLDVVHSTQPKAHTVMWWQNSMNEEEKTLMHPDSILIKLEFYAHI